jgi:spermidine synthase
LAGAAAVSSARIPDSPPRVLSNSKSTPWWYLFFFVSGFPALLYQIVWERSLFALYGVNVESVTMVVTAFMLGLGLGSVAGGIVSRRRHWPLLGIFGLIELLTGLYGVVSLRLFHWAANFTAGSSSLHTGLIAFILVALPTVFMGATLPILVSYTVRVSRNVGMSVGGLYSANTLGSATACFCAGLFLMRRLGQTRTVELASGLNAIVGTLVLVQQFRRNSSLDEEKPQPPSSNAGRDCAISFPSALIISAVAGFIALGYEIVWYRLFSFTTAGDVKSFAFLLGAYLFGIAVGSDLVNRICENVAAPKTFIRFLFATIFCANVLGFLVSPLLFYLVVHVSFAWTLVPIGIAGAGLGAVFPMTCHISIPPDGSAGARTSYLYLSNIVGSALGSYGTGFVLMDVLPLRQVTMVLTLLGLGLGGIVLLSAGLPRGRFTQWAVGATAVAMFAVPWAGPLFHHMYEKMMMKGAYAPSMEFRSIVETRSGLVTVSQNGTVFGGGIYDGRFNVSLANDTNGVERPFALSYFHPDPREVLMIGLSSGSWAQVIANNPQVEHLTIVEINPGYLRLIANVADVASLLTNPKVRIEIDDGRRWLVRNRGRRFDAIVMNNTYNWRANASNLLSVEFLQLVREHLLPGGVAFYNTTESNDVFATGVRFFPYGMRYGGFLLISDSPLRLDARHWRDVLLAYRIDGKPVLDLSREQDRRILDRLMSLPTTIDRDAGMPFPLESADHIRSRTREARTITDDNMGTEWFHNMW